MAATKTEGPPLSVSEAARELIVMRNHVLNLIAAGVLEAEKVNRKWRVNRESVERRKRTVNNTMATTRRVRNEKEFPA